MPCGSGPEDQGMSRSRRAVLYGFIAFAQVAVLGNSIAAVFAARDSYWLIALGHTVIALSIEFAAFVGWYTTTRGRPYRWRPDDD